MADKSAVEIFYSNAETPGGTQVPTTLTITDSTIPVTVAKVPKSELGLEHADETFRIDLTDGDG